MQPRINHCSASERSFCSSRKLSPLTIYLDCKCLVQVFYFLTQIIINHCCIPTSEAFLIPVCHHQLFREKQIRTRVYDVCVSMVSIFT